MGFASPLRNPSLSIVSQRVVSDISGGFRIFQTGVTEYFDPPPENPGPGPNFTEKVGPPHTKDILIFI